MTDQEVFNRVWNYFVVEKHPKSIVGESCVYYDSETGNRCAIGCLLPEEVAKNIQENHASASIYILWHNKEESIINHLGSITITLLSDLQYAHDHYFTILQYSLTKIAAKHNLIIPTEETNQ